jgi:hypothetical protein
VEKNETVKFTNAQYKTGVIEIAVAAMTARPVLKLCGKETADIPTLKKTIGLRQLFFGGRIYEKISKGGKGLNCKLLLAIFFTMLLPGMYPTVRIHFLGEMPSDWGVNIASRRDFLFGSFTGRFYPYRFFYKKLYSHKFT